ncbi:MAG TPA: hypothetical protein VJZ26_09725 [Blastocatellia bacterium]|nr:hypothetical protein [Blastocatellia bacterium]
MNDLNKENGSGDEKLQDAKKLLMALLPIYDSYHNQKENMAYLAATLYLAGASALYFQQPFWVAYKFWQLLVLIAFLLVFSILVFSFVGEQLKLRRSAGDMFRACSDLLSMWITTAPDEGVLASEEFRDDETSLFDKSQMPTALAGKIRELKRQHTGGWWARDITFAAMLLAGGSVLARILYQWL